jgi:histidyl-tRNA synthetase
MTQETLLYTLPGMRDLLPDELTRWQFIEQATRDTFGRYGFREIRTPLIEATELFARSIGQETDIVGKEMYTFLDQSGKSITLRPEATASVVRAYAQHAMYRGSGTTKLYYLGPMFRHEKKQKGRWRQFYQIGAEVLGSDHPAVEVETIEMVISLLSMLEVKVQLLVNSVGCSRCRPQYIELLRADLQRLAEHLCEDCRRRSVTNALRVLDCKVESCQPYIEQLPRITDHLCEECSTHFDLFRKHLTMAAIPFEITPRLVRGLDYYVRTAFEIVSVDLGAQNALVGGGRYDGLSEVLGGPPVSGFGFAMGLDRLVMLLPEHLSSRWVEATDLFLAHMGERAFERALELARAFRREGFRCNIDLAGGSLKSQLRLANRLNARHVLIIGEDELASGRYLLKNLSDSSQLRLEPAEIIRQLRMPVTGHHGAPSDEGA